MLYNRHYAADISMEATKSRHCSNSPLFIKSHSLIFKNVDVVFVQYFVESLVRPMCNTIFGDS